MANGSGNSGNVVVVGGMFGNDKTYFADSPVVVDISGLAWPEASPFNIVRMEVVRADGDGEPADTVGDFRAETGGQESVSFDISSALRAIWIDEDFSSAVEKAKLAINSRSDSSWYIDTRLMRRYFLRIYTEYLASDDGGVYVTTQCSTVIDGVEYTTIPGGQCLIGKWTEWERGLVANKEDADASSLEHTGLRNGDASTKPTSSPERVGSTSITSWVDVAGGYTRSIFWPATYDNGGWEDDDPPSDSGSGHYTGHAPMVIRDSVPYIDFIFVNRRGAVETCSALMMEAMEISVETTTYTRTGGAAFKPLRSMTSVSKGGRRSWNMSSGGQTREWTEWWVDEFLMAKRWWMRVTDKGKPSGTGTLFVPVVVEPAKKEVDIYDRAKQGMGHVDFVVRMGLEG